MKLNMKYIVTAGLSLALVTGCANWSRTAKGAAIGGAVGGALGGLIGKKTGNTTIGILVGAAVGGTAGAAIGNYMDKQAEELKKDLKDAKVERVGEGIKITFASGILFDVGKANLQSAAKENISQLARVLQKYEDTEILIQGHTDADGSEEANMKLSEERAASVVQLTLDKGIARTRITAVGYGEEMPVASNDTVEGKAQNRRVEVAIMANEKLKKAAEDGRI